MHSYKRGILLKKFVPPCFRLQSPFRPSPTKWPALKKPPRALPTTASHRIRIPALLDQPAAAPWDHPRMAVIIPVPACSRARISRSAALIKEQELPMAERRKRRRALASRDLDKHSVLQYVYVYTTSTRTSALQMQYIIRRRRTRISPIAPRAARTYQPVWLRQVHRM